MAKLDDFENNSETREYKMVPSGTYKVIFDKVSSKETSTHFKMYNLFLKVLDEGEYKGQFIFPRLLSGWATDKGEGNHLAQLRALLRVIVSQNLDDLKLKKFYSRIFKEDLEITEFFEEILESNILTGKEFTIKVVSTKGKPYTDKDGNIKEGNTNYNLDLSSTVEMEALDKINKAETPTAKA